MVSGMLEATATTRSSLGLTGCLLSWTVSPLALAAAFS